MAYRDTILTDTPIEYWELNETSGTNAASTGSGAHAATHSGGVVVGASGVAVVGATYDGVDDLTTTPTTVADFMGGTTFTVEMWVKFDGTYTNDYPTFFRRDGAGKTFLIRTRNTSVGSAHTIETYFNGKTTSTGTTTFNDNNWHHVVVVRSSTTLRLWVDNVEYTTTNGTITSGGSGATTGNIGRGLGAGEYFRGGIDEVAIYTSALSTTRIAAHYNAGLPVNISYTASVMTASGAAPNAVAIPVKNNSWTAAAVTASATMPGGAYAETRTSTVTNDAYTSTSQPDANINTSMLFAGPSGGATYRTYIGLPSPSLTTGETLASAILRLYPGSNQAAATLSIYRVTSAWDESTLTYNTAPTTTLLGTVSKPSGASAFDLDLTTLVSQTNYGVMIESSVLVDFNSSENATNKPSVTYLVTPPTPTSVSYSSPPLTANATMVDSAVSVDSGPVIAPMTASASMPSALAEAQHDGGFIAEPMYADTTMPGGLFSYPAVYAASVTTASASMPTVAVSTTIGAKVVASAMTATAKLVAPFSVNDIVLEQNESDDPYSNRVSALAPKYWWRFNDSSSVVKDTVTGATVGTPSAVYRNGAIGNQATAPEGRKAVHFPLGGYIEQNEPFGSNTDEMTFTTGSVVRTVLEFSMKTNKANQFVMAGADKTVGPNGVASDAGATEIFVQNGKLGYRAYQYGNFGGGGTNNVAKEFVGFTTVADDEWHHITIRSGIKSGVRDEYGVEIWIDGKMDVRRYFTQSWIGMPDFIGARYATFDSAVLPPLPLSQNYEGDIAELVWYADTTHVPDDITRNYYAFFGYRPIEAPAMEATATMADAKGKGNQKKALYLYWSDQDEVFGGMPGNYSPGQGSLVDNRYYISFDPMPNLAGGSYQAPGFPRLSEETGEFFGFKVFTKSITRNYSPLGVISYRDPVTDEQSLIDLTRDIDLSDYDVIMFKDWPDEGYETEWYETNYPGQKERLLQQLRDANEDGIGLYVTNPRLAVDLGIVDRVEFVEPLTEHKAISGQGRAAGLYDYGSALKFPWNIVSADGLTGNPYAAGIGQEQITSPSYLASKAYFYFDNNRNNKFRVVAKINGLTDLPSYMIEDAVFHVDAEEYGWEGAAYKYLHRLNGLEIGDEYIFNGAPTIDTKWMDPIELRYLRSNGTWATPPNHVKAGTIVTTFGSKQFVGGVETTNPYQDYATTIVLESGTILNGRSTGGRIFVNFTETPSSGLDVPVQVLPGSIDALDNPLGVEPDADIDAPIFIINGTPDQIALTEEALSRCTFPFDKLQNKVKAKWGIPTFPIVWEDIEPGEDSGVLGEFHPLLGKISIDEEKINSYALETGQDEHNLSMMTVIHELAHLIDYIYLQPYQRVNIWNVFHGDWNVWHEDQNLQNYILPQNYPLDMMTEDIINGEGWTAPPRQYRTKNMAEAFAQAFVQAYSDIPVDVFAFTSKSGNVVDDGHPAPESIGPLIRAAIEVGQGLYLFDQSQVESGWPPGYTPETDAQREWEYSWTRTSLSFSLAPLKQRIVNVTMPDGSVQKITQGSTIKTRQNIPLSMVRSGQLFPVLSKPRLEMTARGIYWLADAEKVAEGDAVVRATTMDANGAAPSATVIAERSEVVLAQSMTANAMMTESEQAKSGNAQVLASPMTAEARMSQGNERTITVTPMTATGTMPDSVYESSGEAITLRLPRPTRVTLRIKEAV